jgi:hypothetical protein
VVTAEISFTVAHQLIGLWFLLRVRHLSPASFLRLSSAAAPRAGHDAHRYVHSLPLEVKAEGKFAGWLSF